MDIKANAIRLNGEEAPLAAEGQYAEFENCGICHAMFLVTALSRPELAVAKKELRERIAREHEEGRQHQQYYEL